MRLALLLALFVLTTLHAQTPTPDPLSYTLLNGKVLHFESAEQKAKFEAGRQRAASVARDEEIAQRNRQAAEDARGYELYALKRQLARNVIPLWVYIHEFQGPWTEVSAYLAIETYPGSNHYERGAAVEGIVYIEWTPPKDVVNGAERIINAWECGVVELNNRRYKRFTTSAERAYQYLTDPDKVNWPPLHG